MATYIDIINQLEEEKEPTEDTMYLANSLVHSGKDSRMLHWAVELRELNDVVLLLKHGADINAVDKNGLTALHLAAAHGRKDMGGDGFKSGSIDSAIVMLLLEHGADYNARDRVGWLPERYTLEPRTGTNKKNTEEHRDFLAIIEAFKARTSEKKRHSSDETARDSDEREALLGSESRQASSSASRTETPFSVVGAVTSFISNAFGLEEKPARYKE